MCGRQVSRNRRSRQHGSIMVEFALTGVMMFTIFTGVYGFGYSMFAYNALQQGVRDGCRYASRKPYDSNTGTPSQAFLTAVQNMVVYNDPAGGSTPIVTGLTTNNVQLTMDMNGGTPVGITVSLVNFQLDALFVRFQLNGSPSIYFPYLGIPTPS